MKASEYRLKSGLELVYRPCAVTMEAIYRLRPLAWRARTVHFPDIDIWRDEFDDSALHWAILDAGTPVAAARMTIHDRLADVPSAEIYEGVIPSNLKGPIACITRLVVHPNWAGQGLPRILDEARIAEARKQSCAHMIGETYAGMRRIAAMRELGFIILGETAPYPSGPLAEVKNRRGGGALLPQAIILNLI